MLLIAGRRLNMNNITKILCLLISVFFVMPISAMRDEAVEVENCKISSGLNSGMFRQYPYGPYESGMDCWDSDNTDDLSICYDDFWGIDHPICGIGWWGHSMAFDGLLWENTVPQNMRFDITFYEDNNSMPGAVMYSYDDVVPTVTPTGIMYDWTASSGLDIYEKFYFKLELSPCYEMSNGWISIVGSGSENGCRFVLLCSPDGNDNAYQLMLGDMYEREDFAFMLIDDEEASIQIDVTGGFGSTIGITNSGDETLYDIHVDIMVFGGILRRISAQVEDTISSLEPDETKTIEIAFLGFGGIAIGVIADDVVEYKNGMQLFIYTLL